jgi:outer membrane autotransporter protein
MNFGITADSEGDEPGYRGWGFGLTGGYELGRTPLGTFGLTMAGGSSQLKASGAISGQALTVDMFETGGYWRQTLGRLSADARLAGDYLRIGGDRSLVSADADGAQVTRTASAHWTGTGVTAHGRLAYEQPLGGAVYLRPQVALDYFRLQEGGYSEYGGGEAVDLTVGSRTSSRLSAFAGLAVGALFGDDNSWGPELLVGWRDVANETLGATTARFTSGGDAFSLAGDAVSGQGIAAHVSLRSENGYGGFAVETGAESRDSLVIWDFRVAAHFQF